MRLWSRTGTEPWQPIGPPWQAVLGRNGLVAEADKREGDGKSPAGTFHITHAYGYADTPPSDAELPYTPSRGLECVDDPRSSHYNQIVRSDVTPHDWTSSEQMRRSDALYTWVIEIAHNAAHTPERGSCIFLHVWGGPDPPTPGSPALSLAWIIARHYFTLDADGCSETHP